MNRKSEIQNLESKMGQELRDKDIAPLCVEEIQRGLVTERLGKRIHYLSEVDSTNLYALRIAEEGAPEGEIVIADSQSRGKGRLGRGWVSPSHFNIYLSVLLRPKLPPLHAPQITLMAAVALAETVQCFIPLPAEIKWPNDILVGGKKLAGILTESSCDPGKILFVILGIGVNLNFPKELMPEAIRESATSIMALTGKPVNRSEFTLRLIQNLERCYGELEEEGFSFLAERWAGFFRLKGKRVRVQMMEQAILGKAMGIDIDGALILEDERGFVQRIVAGEVIPMDA
jgi:BirA family biotin operon repressor/biotin-[acetyl-CoA-carboxylase] ligase